MSRVQSPEAPIKRATVVFLLGLVLTSAVANDTDQYGECSQNDRDAYMQAIQRKLISNWRVPAQHRSVSCTVVVSQNFRGEVLNAGVEDCADDPDLIKSIEDATYLSSPLPPPRNRACFERELRLRIVRKPD